MAIVICTSVASFHKRNTNSKECLCFVATDGHRLAKIDFNTEEKISEIPGVIIPRKTIGELCKLLIINKLLTFYKQYKCYINI